MRKLNLKLDDLKDIIQPFYYDEGLAFFNSEYRYIIYYKENKIFFESEDSLKQKETIEIQYPSNIDEINQLQNLIQFLYQRLANAYIFNKNFEKEYLKFLQDIFSLKEMLKNNLVNQTTKGLV